MRFIARTLLCIGETCRWPFSKLAYLIYPESSVAKLLVFLEKDEGKIRFAFYREIEYPQGIDLDRMSKTGCSLKIAQWREVADNIDKAIADE